MPDHEPFDGTVPWVVKVAPSAWYATRPNDMLPFTLFATWREAMNYATKEDHR